MYDRIYKIPTADGQWDETNPQPQSTVAIASNATEDAYLVGDAGFAAWDALPTAELVGSWEDTHGLQEGQSYDTDGTTVIGTPTHPVTSDYTDWIRPLGNDTGKATGILDATRWAGSPEKKALEDDNRYPVVNTPFSIRFTRVEITDPDPFPGWGWVAEMISDDPLRDITARAIGIYADPDWNNYLYTTGAFIQDGSHDNNYYTECPAGQRKADPDPVHYALLFGSQQEGTATLDDPADGAENDLLHWFDDQTSALNVGIVGSGGSVNDIHGGPIGLESPEGYAVESIGAVTQNKVGLQLFGGARDTHDPVLSIFFPEGQENYGMIWSETHNEYRSGIETGVRARIEQYAGQKIKYEIHWL